jgi:sterol desaturase/sphingolipid hydroxylase (fatty acid hydroxylase superfamily)
MNETISKLLKWDTLSVIGLFFLSIGLAVWDPLNLDPLGEESTSAIKAWYLLPAALFIVWFFVRPTVMATRTIEEDAAIWGEKLSSLVRSAIQIIGALIAVTAALNVHVPFLGWVLDIAQYLGDNINTAANAIGVVLGIATTVYGFFRNPDRFERRALGKKLK